MTAPGVASSEVKFSANADGSDDEDYSVSLSAVIRQRRASVRRSRKGRARRPSSPFLPEETRPRRRSSVFTTSSGDTAISIDDQPVVTQEQIFENIHLHKQVLSSAKQQPLGMRRKLKIVHQAKAYIKRHEGQLQERLAQSKSTRDIYARFNILIATKWQQLKREAANTSNLLIPWELRIKEIESHFGSVVASYFTFLRWLFWINLVIGFILLVFVIVPEYLTANPTMDGERKIVMEEDRRNATNLLTLWEFEGVLKYSPIFYGYYSNVERSEYKMPLAYFLTGLVVYVYSFVAILKKMAENSRMSKLSEKDDECIFSWKLFTGWDFMIGNTETAHNRIASVILGFKEALLEEAEKKKNSRNWRTLSLRVLVNICVVILLAVSAYAVVTVVSRSDNSDKVPNWWRENETTTVVSIISIVFPIFFELLGIFEHFHPRKQLRLQLARIMLLNLLNLYSLIFAQFSKIEGMSRELESLQPTRFINATHNIHGDLQYDDTFNPSKTTNCFQMPVPCLPCHLKSLSMPKSSLKNIGTTESVMIYKRQNPKKRNNRVKRNENQDNDISALEKEMERLRNLSKYEETEDNDEKSEADDYEFYDSSYDDTEMATIQSSTSSVPIEDFTTFPTSEYESTFDDTTIMDITKNDGASTTFSSSYSITDGYYKSETTISEENFSSSSISYVSTSTQSLEVDDDDSSTTTSLTANDKKANQTDLNFSTESMSESIETITNNNSWKTPEGEEVHRQLIIRHSGGGKKALPSFPINKSIDSEDRKTSLDENNPNDATKAKRKGIFAKIVSLALDKKSTGRTQSETSQDQHNGDDTDTDFHEALPKVMLKIKAITVSKKHDIKNQCSIMFDKTKVFDTHKSNIKEGIVALDEVDMEKPNQEEKEDQNKERKLSKKQTSQSSNQSKQSDSISSVIPVITISTTESDEEILQHSKTENVIFTSTPKERPEVKRQVKGETLKKMQRQSSVESINDKSSIKEGGHKYQYSL
ncbi:unnamed protein product [Leptosia nina]|uniref:Uncharacterized protein n=1 Tax=Leptosia nina TaxID=320188 RepID=A0AAV1JYT5_9NEOP